jgi:putative ABC transport system substrate-binding protein
VSSKKTGKSMIVRQIVICLLLTVFLLTVGEAQQPKKVHRIGHLDGASPSVNADRIEAFRQGLRELGYVEGKNIIIEWRHAEGKADRLPRLAAELARLTVDVIVTGGAAATRPAKEATATIPIVMGQDSDPVGSGFVASLARPGGNVTGLSTLLPEISGKRLEILKEAVPRLSRVAVFGTSTWAGNAQVLRETELAAGALGVKLQYLDLLDTKNFETAFRTAGNGRADAVLMVVWGAVLNPRRKEVAELAVKSRLPTIYREVESVEDGGL